MTTPSRNILAALTLSASQALALGALLLPSSASAHHSFAMFDSGRSISLTGTVREFAWMNPHGTLWVTVPATDGSTTLWTIQMGPAAGLISAGWKRDDIKKGDKISVEIHPLKDGRTGGSLVKATLADGRTLGEGGARDAYPQQP